MNNERDFYPEDELQGDLQALDAAFQMDIPFESIYEMSSEEVDPDVMYVFNDFEVAEERYYHGLITRCFPSIPNGTVEENALKFHKRFKFAQSIMVDSFRRTGNLAEIVESVTIEELDLAGATDFAAFYSAESENNLIEMSENHEMFKIQEKACEYWNRMDEIIGRAYEIEIASRDPNLDETLKQ